MVQKAEGELAEAPVQREQGPWRGGPTKAGGGPPSKPRATATGGAGAKRPPAGEAATHAATMAGGERSAGAAREGSPWRATAWGASVHSLAVGCTETLRHLVNRVRLMYSTPRVEHVDPINMIRCEERAAPTSLSLSHWQIILLRCQISPSRLCYQLGQESTLARPSLNRRVRLDAPVGYTIFFQFYQKNWRRS